MIGRRTQAGSAGRYAILAVACVVVLVPMLWTLSTSFKTQVDAQSYPPRVVPRAPTLDNYRQLFSSAEFVSSLTTSMVVSLGAALLALAVAFPCAYALVRLRPQGRRSLMLLIVLGQTVPGIVFVIPLYSLAIDAGLYDTRIVLIIVTGGFLTPLATLILASFIRTVPIEVEEAAVVDGASRFAVLWRIVLPLVRPGLASAAIFAAVYAWNEFLIPVILGGESTRPLTVYLSSFVTQKTIEWGPLTAAVCLVLLPVLVVVLAFQRQLMSGLTAGSLKG
jgi:ABC-type glycerol-3-phosphate transport system permease component